MWPATPAEPGSRGGSSSSAGSRKKSGKTCIGGHKSEADFIRDAVFKVRPIVIRTASPTDQEIWQQMVALVNEFNRIGRNYNQVVVKVNTASIPMAQALQESDKTFREVQQSLAQARDALHAYLTDPNKRL